MAIQSEWPLQAFVISEEIFDSVSEEEIRATFADMRQMDIAQPPYSRFDVIVPVHKVMRLVTADGEVAGMAPKDPAATLRVRFEGFTPPASPARYQWLFTRKGMTVDLAKFVADESQRLNRFDRSAETWPEAAAGAYQLVVVLLATKNVVKETRECKLMKLGIGKAERNRYTTTIKVGKVTEQEGTDKGTGIELRPHLRRGHVRRQHHGPHNELIKSIFIQPVFVNADKGWIAERTAYNLIGGSR